MRSTEKKYIKLFIGRPLVRGVDQSIRMEPFDLRKWPGFALAGGDTTHPCIIDQVAIDSRRIVSSHAVFVALDGSETNGHAFVAHARQMGGSLAIIKKSALLESPPGMMLLRVDDPLTALQDIAKAYRQERKATVIAITGSYGKTMLKDLLHQLLASQYRTASSPESFNSQVGAALSLLTIRDTHEVAIIEAGISQKGEMARLAAMICPDHAIMTTVGCAHSSSLGSQEAIIAEKMQLLHHVPPQKWSLLPSNIPLQKGKNQIHWDLLHPDLPHVIQKDIANEKWALHYEVLFQNNVIKGKLSDGLSYVRDLLTMGIKAAALMGVHHERVESALKGYQPEPMRIEFFETTQGALIINDTYCADPMSCEVAMKQLPASAGRRLFFFGGFREKRCVADVERVALSCAKHHIDICVLHNQPELKTALAKYCPHTHVHSVDIFHDAIEYMRTHLGQGDTALIKCPTKIPISQVIAAAHESQPNTYVIINLAAIQANIDAIRMKTHKKRLMIIVKALAYGTDDIRMATFLESIGIDILGVSYVDEGVRLRQAGIQKSIFVLNCAEYEASKAVKYGLEIGVSEPTLIHALQEAACTKQKSIKVHLHVDTGMARFGCRPEHALELARLITSCPNLVFEGIMTHFSSADNPNEDSFTTAQEATFRQTIATLHAHGYHPNYCHAENSAATIRFGFTTYNMVRIGLAAYGLYTSPCMQEHILLKPALSLVSRIVGINMLQKGESISYNKTYTVMAPAARIGILPIGYFDGLHRNYSNKGQVMCRGKLAPMVGAISMDYTMIDISHIPGATIGDPVLIFGEDEQGNYLPPEQLASCGHSIVHELMTCLGPRLMRLFIYDESLRPR